MKYPLLFTFHGLIVGKGFLAGVEICGRLVADMDADGTWLYGVNPGAIAESGGSLDEAHENFRQMMRRTLIDQAATAESFDEFAGGVRAFVEGTNDETEADWRQALDVVRAANVSLMKLPRWSADTSVRVMVKQIVDPAELTPTLNKTDSEAAIASTDGENPSCERPAA